MTNHRRVAAALVAALAASCLAPIAAAQDTLPAPTTTLIAYRADSGPLANPGAEHAVVYTHQVHLPGAHSIRLHFAAASLPEGSYLLATSMLDGEQQQLDAATLALWNDATAYFNGDTVLLELHAAPGTAGNLVRMEAVEAGFVDQLPPEHPLRGSPGECGICGSDDRSLSTQTFAARLMPVGCTASIVCENNAAVTAGHCLGGASVMQFNVPASLGNCALVNPPVADQFPVIASTIAGVNGGVGNDWGVFRVGANSVASGPYQRYGQLRRIAGSMPPVNSVVNIYGYGVDNTCTRNQVQQRSVGTLGAIFASALEFNADVRGGNSGSAILAGNEVIGVVSHCSGGGCHNLGTRIDLSTFAAAINNVSTCDHRLQITARNGDNNAPLAVTIDVSPADMNGDTAGTTPMDRIYSVATSVTVTAPPTAGSLCFSHWQVNGVNQPLNHRVLLLTTSGVHTAMAVYSASMCSSCPADWDDSGQVNSNDISAFLSTWLASVQNGTLEADFDESGNVNSNDISAFLNAWLNAVQNGC